MIDGELPAGGWDWLWLIALGLIGSAIVVTASHRTGVTFDERFYLEAGLERWRTGSNCRLMKAGTMPLPIDVETLPVYLREQWRGTPWNLDAEFHEALGIARRGVLLFWWLTLFYGWRIARGLGGPWAGRLAAAALTFEPTLLAHAGLATTDVAVTGCLLAFAFHYHAGRDSNWKRRVGIPALLAGLTVLAKASALLFVPLCMAAIEFERTRSLRAIVSRRFRYESAGVLGLGLVLVFVYCGSDWQPHPKIVAAAHKLPKGTGRTLCVWLAENARIFGNAGMAILYQVKHNMQGHGSYLLGDTARRAIWFYFPVALSIKLPAALLATALLLLVLARRSLFNWACLAALLMLIFSLNCRVQIGVRLQLPLIALACTGLSAALANAAAGNSRRRALVVGWAIAAVAWMTIAAVQHWPRHLSYINELWGGPENGERLLSDSNFDWGQGLPDLADWCAARGISDVSVWYFGTDPACARPPFHLAPLHAHEIQDFEELRRHARGRYLAVGTTILYGSYIKKPAWLLERLRQSPPVGRTRTFLVYDLAQLEAEK